MRRSGGGRRAGRFSGGDHYAEVNQRGMAGHGGERYDDIPRGPGGVVGRRNHGSGDAALLKLHAADGHHA